MRILPLTLRNERDLVCLAVLDPSQPGSMTPNRTDFMEKEQGTPPIINICACGSSGSTLLAQTIDHHPKIACGDELFFFCSPLLYDQYPQVRKWRLPIRLLGLSGNPYHQGRALFRHSKAYGLSRSSLWRWVAESNDLNDLAYRMQERVLELTGKQLWAEKTPRNIRVIGKFIEAFPAAKVIHIIRDPRDVIASLKKRGKHHLNAAEAWLASIASIAPYRQNQQVLEIRYEDLCADHNKIMEQVCDFLSVDFDASYFSSGAYTSKQLGKFAGHESWAALPTESFSTQSIGRYKNVQLDWSLISNIRLTSPYAKLLGTKQWSLGELAKSYGYEMPGNSFSSRDAGYTVFHSGWRLSAIRRSFDSLLSIPPYINMIEYPNALRE